MQYPLFLRLKSKSPRRPVRFVKRMENTMAKSSEGKCLWGNREKKTILRVAKPQQVEWTRICFAQEQIEKRIVQKVFVVSVTCLTDDHRLSFPTPPLKDTKPRSLGTTPVVSYRLAGAQRMRIMPVLYECPWKLGSTQVFNTGATIPHLVWPSRAYGRITHRESYER